MIFDFDLGPEFDWRNKEFFDLRKVSRKSEYLSELKMPNVFKVFNKNFYFEKQNGPKHTKTNKQERMGEKGKDGGLGAEWVEISHPKPSIQK